MPEYPLDSNLLMDVLPNKPGVYLFKDKKDNVLYVGKAKDLKKRILTYLIRQGELSDRINLMLKATKGVDIIVTNTENEAFILERNLIKKWMPRFNILLRDDKQYPLLRIDTKETFPNITIVRRMKKDGARYFGPYTSSNAMRDTLRILFRAFPLRKCKGPLKPKARPCLNYQMKRCLGPCAGLVSEEEYKKNLLQALQLLEGKGRSLIERLRKEMLELSESMEFERAAILRDRIKAIQRTLQPQAVVSYGMEDMDIIGIASGIRYMHVVVLRLRDGILQENISYRLSGISETEEALSAFIKQFYPEMPAAIPEVITIPTKLEDSDEIANWLTELKEAKVSIKLGASQNEKRLLRMATENAQRLAEEEAGKEDLLEGLKETLRLRRYPKRIECVDISNMGGDWAVGAIACFVDSKPYKKGYRSFVIKTVEGIDDYKMMREVVSRRMKYPDHPDLLVIDGGKGHLNAINQLINEELHLDDPPDLLALAKADQGFGVSNEGELDKVYILNRKDPIRLPKALTLFLMWIRDEAHRRAISHHKKRKGMAVRSSFLDEIKGIGQKRKKMLLKEFGSLEGILSADIRELTRLPGITEEIANEIIKKGKQLEIH